MVELLLEMTAVRNSLQGLDWQGLKMGNGFGNLLSRAGVGDMDGIELNVQFAW